MIPLSGSGEFVVGPPELNKTVFHDDIYEEFEEVLPLRLYYRSSYLHEACNLLSMCLEFDNGAEKNKDRITDFINKHTRTTNGTKT